MRLCRGALPILSVFAVAGAEYIWPSEFDFLEDLLSLQSGYLRNGFIDLVMPCSFGSRSPGRQNAAEWIRAAFHDMITHNAAAAGGGTGGMDASAAFEADREESAGGAINNTFGFLNGFFGVRASASDLLAMSVIVALAGCDGPKLPFRAGRVDATQAGPPGVPQPHEDLDTFLERFRTAGFERTEMISLVACGHTLGGVHSLDFPEITGDGDDDDGGGGGDGNDTVVKFDGSFADFDTGIVTEYLDGTTKNPLVVGRNMTLNSDLAVFGSDGNNTMTKLRDPQVFRSTCADLLSRMIDTVPATVTLSEPITPPEIKPYLDAPSLSSFGNITFKGQVRVRTTQGTGRDPDDLSVQITFRDRGGASSPRTVSAQRARFQGGFATGLYGENFVWFEFDTEIDPASGISRFNIHVTTPSTGTVEDYDNGGDGYPASDSIVYLRSRSCLATNASDSETNLRVVAGLREGQDADSLVLNVVHRVPRPGVVVPRLDQRKVEFQRSGEEQSGYVMYEVRAGLAIESWSTTFDIVGNPGSGSIEFQSTGFLFADSC